MRKMRLPALVICLCALCLSGCDFSKTYYLSGEGSYRPVLAKMFSKLDRPHESRLDQFVYMHEIIRGLRATKHTRRLNLLLTDYVARHRKDPYDAYYLYVVAEDYLHAHAYPFAELYLNRIVTDYPNVDLHGTSIDYLSLAELAKLTNNPYDRITYYQELLSHFATVKSRPAMYYHLALSYHSTGQWGKEMQAYENFLQQHHGTVPGVPGARQRATYLVDLYNYPDKSWAFSSLNKLVGAIRYAVALRSVRLLSRYWAKVGFFAHSWESQQAWPSGAALLVPLFLRDFYAFMSPSVYVAPSLGVDSDRQEAYLRTGGWSWRIPTWYFYFKKINFPEDPNIQGKWEWAGIYFGHKLFWRGGF